MLWLPGKENSSAFKPLVRFGFMLETYTVMPNSICGRFQATQHREKLIHFGKN
jgi:hypothetical protein